MKTKKIKIEVNGFCYELTKPIKKCKTIDIRIAGKDYFIPYSKIKGETIIDLTELFLKLL